MVKKLENDKYLFFSDVEIEPEMVGTLAGWDRGEILSRAKLFKYCVLDVGRKKCKFMSNC